METFLIDLSYYIHFISGDKIIAGICAAVALILLAKKQFTQFKIFSISTVLTVGLTLLIKNITRIDRPIDALIGLDGYAFPSGHAAISFFFLTFLINYILKSKRNKTFKIISISIFAIIAVLVSASRIILGVHTIFQVTAGAILGTLVTAWAIKIVSSLPSKHSE